MTSTTPPPVRLAELVATISLGTDLGLGQPMEHVIRQTVIALRMGALLGLDEADRRVLYYSGLLAWVGCHTDAYEQAKWFGDDIAMKRDSMTSEQGPVDFARFFATHVGAGRPVVDRLRTGLTFPREGLRWFSTILETHWRATDLFAERLGLGDDVRRSLVESYERWDGKGAAGLCGKEIRLTSRVVYFADVVAAFERFGGYDAAVEVARSRSGTHFDPEIVAVFSEHSLEVMAGLDAGSHWEEILAAEPGLATMIGERQLDGVLEAIADFVDLKSPWFLGHSRRVAELAGVAAIGLGLSPDDATLVRRAGLVHDFGRLGISNGIWDKVTPLTVSEQERVRLHPYLTERMLAFSPRLAELGTIAVQHHERQDGSGYPRGLSGSAITLPGRVLAAADCYATMREDRPHRSAGSASEAAAALRDEARAGRLDGEAVSAVLEAAGHDVRRRPREWPAGLSSREVEVLRLVARGLTNKEIAARLTIAPKTAGAHVEHIYAKTGAKNRATAGLFAMSHGLMHDAGG